MKKVPVRKALLGETKYLFDVVSFFGVVRVAVLRRI